MPASPPLRRAVHTLLSAGFDELFTALDPYSRYLTPEQAQAARDARVGQSALGCVSARGQAGGRWWRWWSRTAPPHGPASARAICSWRWTGVPLGASDLSLAALLLEGPKAARRCCALRAAGGASRRCCCGNGGPAPTLLLDRREEGAAAAPVRLRRGTAARVEAARWPRPRPAASCWICAATAAGCWQRRWRWRRLPGRQADQRHHRATSGRQPPVGGERPRSRPRPAGGGAGGWAHRLGGGGAGGGVGGWRTGGDSRGGASWDIVRCGG